MNLLGNSISHYRVLAKIGEGGMGEVYRARDTKLDRDVALKILPESFATDPDRRARFEREAKTLAVLNHPQIAQIYGIEEAGGVRALVMELVEGEDLAQRLARGAMPLDDALGVARQIADALEAAHEANIVHRDLKPANIKLRPDGTVKVLDFGLAKALDVSAAGVGAHASLATITSPAVTQLGVILGTAAYMAPEQAKGKPVDRRVDIFAFGCVLFEMLAGRRPFEGESVPETLAAILTKEPDWKLLNPRTPAAVRRLLVRCLEKEPRRRLRDIGEARIALEDAKQDAAEAPVATRAGSRWATRIATAVALVAAGAAGYFLATQRAPARSASIITSFAQITDQPGIERQPTISPDGKSVVYVSQARGNSDLYLLRVGGRNSILLTPDSPEDDFAPAFSPDGARIAFRSERSGGGIFVMEATGESVRRVSDSGYDPSWSPDGQHLVVADERVADPMSRSRESFLWIITIADGKRRRVLAVDSVGPRWSPNGKRIAFWGRAGNGSQRDIGSVAADGSEEKSPVYLTSDTPVDWSPTWSPDGRYVYFASSRGGTMNLWRLAVDESSGRHTGEPEPITTPAAWSGSFEFASDGRSLVFADQDERTTVWAATFDPAAAAIVGQPREVLHGRAINSIDVSPDGQTVVFSQRGRPWESLGTVRIDGTGWTRITDDAQYHRLPTWTADGKSILFYMSRGLDTAALWSVRPDGSNVTEVLTDTTGVFYPVASPDGTRGAASISGEFVIFDMSVSPVRVLKRVGKNEATPDMRAFSWSADGRRIAGTSRSGNLDELMVADVETGSVRMLTEHANSPAWLPDSRRLLYSGLTHLVVRDADSGGERPVLALPHAVETWGRTVSLSKDGRTLVYLQTQPQSDIWLMTLR